MNSKTGEIINIEYLASLLSPDTSARGLSLTIPQEVLVTAQEVSAHNFLVYIGRHEAKERLLNVCLHAYVLGYLGQIYGFRRDVSYWPLILQNNGLDSDEKIDHLDFCLGSCLIAGKEAGDPAFYEKRHMEDIARAKELYEKACVLVGESNKKISTSFLQRNLRIGYSVAEEIRALLILNNVITEERSDPEEQQQREDELVEKNYGKARRLVIQSQKASVQFLQKQLSIGYRESVRILDLLEADKIVGHSNGFAPRDVLVKKLGPEHLPPY